MIILRNPFVLVIHFTIDIEIFHILEEVAVKRVIINSE